MLRAYVGCATALFGDVSQADVIKLHKASGKVTFLVYDDFEGKPLPELRHRIKVNLRTRWVQVFDHSQDGQMLLFQGAIRGGGASAAGENGSVQREVAEIGIVGRGADGADESGGCRDVGEGGIE